MMPNFWSTNHPRNYWLCQPDLSDEVWQKAIKDSLPVLDLNVPKAEIDSILEFTLGEARFGPDHWRLSLPKRIYYLLKPILPRTLTRVLRRLYSHPDDTNPNLHWPVESRYADFLWEIMAQLLRTVPGKRLYMKSLWPDNFRYAFVLTHDIESVVGQSFVHVVADLEESLGFRSSFNFVPERYHIDINLMDELRQRGFEIGIHGLKHDGKLFSSRKEFERRAVRINQYLKEFGAVGFRSPLTHRNPEWMQLLDIEYDLSFFDTDPFEPIPGGAMSIWPFFLGHFVELPYTLVQDYSLTALMGETTSRLWLEKVDFIEHYHGMTLLNSHPDYLKNLANMKIYSDFLTSMSRRDGFWHALPRDVTAWWRNRTCSESWKVENYSTISLENGTVTVNPDAESHIDRGHLAAID